jgi:hypothetical protein
MKDDLSELTISITEAISMFVACKRVDSLVEQVSTDSTFLPVSVKCRYGRKFQFQEVDFFLSSSNSLQGLVMTWATSQESF